MSSTMVYCAGCGAQIHESAKACPNCGFARGASAATADAIPDGVKGWSWGAFLLNWIWGIGNSVWIALLCLVPYVGLIMAIVLGVKGREWAWKAKKWDSLEHFNRVQRSWSKWGVIVCLIGFVVGIVVAIAMPAIIMAIAGHGN